MTRRKGLKQGPRRTDALQEKDPISENRNRPSKGRRRAKLFPALSCFFVAVVSLTLYKLPRSKVLSE